MSLPKNVTRLAAAGTMALAMSALSLGSAALAQTIKIGSVLSITGPASFLGDLDDGDADFDRQGAGSRLAGS